jgi:hypothetical protein
VATDKRRRKEDNSGPASGVKRRALNSLIRHIRGLTSCDKSASSPVKDTRVAIRHGLVQIRLSSVTQISGCQGLEADVATTTSSHYYEQQLHND